MEHGLIMAILAPVILITGYLAIVVRIRIAMLVFLGIIIVVIILLIYAISTGQVTCLWPEAPLSVC